MPSAYVFLAALQHDAQLAALQHESPHFRYCAGCRTSLSNTCQNPFLEVATSSNEQHHLMRKGQVAIKI